MLNLQITMQQPKIHSKFLHEYLEMMYIFYDLKKGLPLCVKQTVCPLHNYLTEYLQRHLCKDILLHARYSERTFLVEIIHMKHSCCGRTLASFVNDGN